MIHLGKLLIGQKKSRGYIEIPTKKQNKREAPRKILVNFLSFQAKELVLLSALKTKATTFRGFTCTIRSDLCLATLDRQWAMGKKMAVLQGFGIKAQLKFPAAVKAIWHNTMYILRTGGRRLNYQN